MRVPELLHGHQLLSAPLVDKYELAQRPTFFGYSSKWESLENVQMKWDKLIFVLIFKNKK